MTMPEDAQPKKVEPTRKIAATLIILFRSLTLDPGAFARKNSNRLSNFRPLKLEDVKIGNQR